MADVMIPRITARQLVELIDTGVTGAGDRSVVIGLSEPLLLGDRDAWHEVVLAVARRVPEASL